MTKVRVVHPVRPRKKLDLATLQTMSEADVLKRWPEVEQVLNESAQTQSRSTVDCEALDRLLTFEELQALTPEQAIRYQDLAERSATAIWQQAQQQKGQQDV